MGETVSPVELEGTIGDIRDGLKDLPAKVQELATEVESWLDWLADWMVEEILDLLAWIGEVCQDIADKISDAFAFMGDPFTLWSYASSWTDIAATCNERAGSFDLDSMSTDDEWEGKAATAYKNVLPPQKESLRGVANGAELLNSVLDNMAVGIVVFWIGVAVALVKLIGEIVAEISAACSGVGIPAAVGGAAWSAGSTWGILAALWAAFETWTTSSVISSLTDLENGLNENEGLDEGHWPSLPDTVDLADSSHKDDVGHDVKADEEDWRTVQDPD